ncbi:hypothetical protein L837_4049 [Mycobacterium avium MAV_061107_1842]|nr:hypothetical protein L837_4049 [Mycobacterium avium MAV_061107_1842]
MAAKLALWDTFARKNTPSTGLRDVLGCADPMADPTPSQL